MGLIRVALLGILVSGCAAPPIPAPRVYTGDDFKWVRYNQNLNRTTLKCNKSLTCVVK